jgi:hypothetical protein
LLRVTRGGSNLEAFGVADERVRHSAKKCFGFVIGRRSGGINDEA